MISRVQIRQFLAVVDMGNFTRAAQSLNVAQASLSSGIAELERRLGVQLFVREKRRIGLTPAGNALLPLARSIERDFHRAETQAGNLPVPLKAVRLGVLKSIATSMIEQIICAHSGGEPVELLEGSANELLAALGQGSIDLALSVREEGNGPFAAEPLLTEDYCMAIPAKHPLAQREMIDPEEVAGETMIARRSCELLAETSRFFTQRGIRPRFSLRSTNDDRIMAMVRAGLGITVAPASHAGPGISMVRLNGFNRTRSLAVMFGPHWQQEYGADHALLIALRNYVRSPIKD